MNNNKLRTLSDRLAGVCLACVLALISSNAAKAQTVVTLVTLNGNTGTDPQASLAQGTDGNFYGTTSAGGNTSCVPPYGCGTVFRVTPGGVLTTLYSFCQQTNCADGSVPYAGLTLGVDGNFYGATSTGGAHGGGTVFRITAQGKLATVYNFCSDPSCADGESPISTLVQTSNGDLYGTGYGGAYGVGTIFRIAPQGTLTTVYSFCAEPSCPDGSNPRGGLIRGTNGDLYGTTYSGGGSGYGTIFKIAPGGQLTTLHSFDFTDGANPAASLVQASNGSIYGSTSLGGKVLDVCGSGCGTVFKISPSGKFSVLQVFDWSDGSGPNAGMVQATDGNLYGTTAVGLGEGTAFEVTPSGDLTTLIGFYGGPTGEFPYGGIIQGTNGLFYGTTSGDGFVSDGTVFSLNTGLKPFVSLILATAQAGQAIQILGQGLTGTTSVTFNGTLASFKVVSDTFMTAVVPNGATTGAVVVATPTGPLTSNVAFRISK